MADSAVERRPGAAGLAGPLRARLDRLSGREAWLLVILALNLAGGLALYAGDWAGRQKARYLLAASSAQEARQQQALAARGVLSAADRTALSDLGARSLEVRDVWMARLMVEQALVRALGAAHVNAPEIKVAEALEGARELPVLRAEASGPWSGRGLTAALEQLASDDPAPLVQGVRAGAGTTPEFRLTLLYPVRIGPAAAP